MSRPENSSTPDFETFTISRDPEREVTVPRGITFEPINDRERSAAQDPSAIPLPEVAWNSIIARIKDFRAINTQLVQNVTSLPEADSRAIFIGMQARGIVEVTADALGRFALIEDPKDLPEDQNRQWGVVIVNHPLNGHDFRTRPAQVIPPRFKQQSQGPAEGTRVPDPHQRFQAEHPTVTGSGAGQKGTHPVEPEKQ